MEEAFQTAHMAGIYNPFEILGLTPSTQIIQPATQIIVPTLSVPGTANIQKGGEIIEKYLL